MKKSFLIPFFIAVAALVAAPLASAQSFQTAPGHPSASSVPCVGPVFQNTSCTAVGGVGVSCTAGDTQYLRRFELDTEFGITLQFDVTSVDIGIDSEVNGFEETIEVYLKTIPRGDAMLFGNMTTIAGPVVVLIPAFSGFFDINVPIVGSVVDPTTTDLIIEYDALDNDALIFPGANSDGETTDAWIASVTCGISEPIELGAIGFDDSHTILAARGAEIPVELISFDAIVSGTDVSLNWATASETNNAGFEVQVQDGESWNALGWVEGHGTTTEAQTYSYTAEDLGVGTHTFRLKQIDFDGAFEYSDELEVTVETPGTHLITSAYPNPFNPQSQFTLAVAQDQLVTAELFNTLGQLVAVLFNGTVEANQAQLVTIDGAGLASGMYVVRVTGERFSDALSVTLLK